MNKPPARKGEQNRVIFNCRVDAQTMEAIKMLASLWQCSQSEVIDKWYQIWIEHKRRPTPQGWHYRQTGDEMNAISKARISRIEAKYNPEFDVPAEPQVTWVDMYLIQIIQDQQAQIEKLQRQVDAIASHNDEADAMFKQHQQMKEAM